MPDRDTIMAWVEKNPEFSSQYAKSRDRGLDSMAEETLEIADDGTNDWMEKRNADGSTYEAVNTEHIQRSRLRVDTRKWYLSKLAPKRYGDSARVEHTGADGKDLPAIGVTDILESARLIAFALESAARMQRTPGDGAKVIEGTSAAGAANAATEPQDATQDETEGGTGK